MRGAPQEACSARDSAHRRGFMKTSDPFREEVGKGAAVVGPRGLRPHCPGRDTCVVCGRLVRLDR